jgi:hypothetical protein
MERRAINEGNQVSNHNKPRFSLSGSTPPPPLTPPPPPATASSGIPADFAELLERFPLPWCVGPYGDIWVAADVEEVDPAVDGSRGLIDNKWRATGDKARLVMENPAGVGIAALIVHAVNKLGKA